MEIEVDDEDTCPADGDEDKDVPLVVAKPMMYDLRFGQNSHEKEISLLGGKVKHRKWEDILPGKADVNKPEELYTEEGCAVACKNLDDHIELLQTTHGKAYFNLPYASFDSNYLLFKHCKCASSRAKNMVDYLKSYGYKPYHAFGELIYMSE